MTLVAGTRLGPYEILAPIGAGGMGEVFRARDTRLGRDVALKVLPTSVAADAGRLQRFEQEARASAALNHPNILVVHDVGTDRGIPYVVSELLDGRTLRHALDTGALTPRKAADYALQIASGLAAAHERGIVHRDLKPENVFVTRDGRAKILDFGLAKLVTPSIPGASKTTALQTDPGTVLGTAGYMSPEQLRGEDVDHRSDIFSLGAILYELYSHERAFKGRTAVETMSAILKEDPPELGPAVRGVSPAIERVIRRCLEKNPAERFQSARDVLFAFDAVSSVTSGAHSAPAVAPARRIPIAATILIAAITGLIAAAFGSILTKRISAPPSVQPTFKQLTFRSGTVRGARFAPDGKTIVYGAAWEGRPIELYSNREERPESNALSVPPADLLAISSTGEMAVSLKARPTNQFIISGTLARTPISGGAPRELLEKVVSADWSADGKQLAVVRVFDNLPTMRLEYPAGTVLYSAPYWISDARLSPDGSSIAFITHAPGGDEGDVEVIDIASRQRRTLSRGWASIQGLAWAPTGREVWFTATKAGSNRPIWAVSTSGLERLVLRLPRRLLLHDIAADGRLLVTGMTTRSQIVYGSVRDSTERDLSWFDWCTSPSLTPDGRLLAFTESGEGAGTSYGVYVRPTDGSPAVRLGDGNADAISPDGKWVVGRTLGKPGLMLFPTGPGEIQRFETAPLERLLFRAGGGGIGWFPDSRRFIVVGVGSSHKVRSYEIAAAGGPPTPVTPEGIFGTQVSPDGRWLAVVDPAGVPQLFPVGGGPLKTLGLAPADAIIGWLADSRSAFVRTAQSPAVFSLSRVDIESGRRTAVGTLAPKDPVGVMLAGASVMAHDGDHYVIVYFRELSELLIVNGVK